MNEGFWLLIVLALIVNHMNSVLRPVIHNVVFTHVFFIRKGRKVFLLISPIVIGLIKSELHFGDIVLTGVRLCNVCDISEFGESVHFWVFVLLFFQDSLKRTSLVLERVEDNLVSWRSYLTDILQLEPFDWFRNVLLILLVRCHLIHLQFLCEFLQQFLLILESFRRFFRSR